ncbi:hypothetical protein ST47_g3369 [Ascochyta rabiei]|uniref:Uncharacterized protein n=1 Tax=Didymella rabiei TaxID=5454 RepID=A0A163HVT0_DIDRA|nr:hypothetical protein ST47_g3369 [Ascochyta rabiei]
MFVLPHPNYAEIPEPDHDGHEYSVEEIINYSHEHAPGLLDVTPVPERIVIAPQVKYTVRQASTEMILIGSGQATALSTLIFFVGACVKVKSVKKGFKTVRFLTKAGMYEDNHPSCEDGKVVTRLQAEEIAPHIDDDKAALHWAAKLLNLLDKYIDKKIVRVEIYIEWFEERVLIASGP